MAKKTTKPEIVNDLKKQDKEDGDVFLEMNIGKTKVQRFSNNDFYEFVTELKLEVEKEMNFRLRDKFPGGEKHENAAQLQGLHMGLHAVIQRYKIFAKPSKAF